MTYLDKSEKEQARIRRMKRSDQEKYAQEALEKLDQEGLGKKFGRTIEREFNAFGQGQGRTPGRGQDNREGGR